MALGFRASNTLFRNLLRLASTKTVLFPESRVLKWGCVYDSGSSICSDEYLIERRFCTQIQQPLPSEREVQRRPVRISGRKSRHRSGNRAPVVWSHRQHGGFSSAAQSCPTLCNPMDCSTPGFPVHHQLPELAQTHVHGAGDAIQPSHPLLSPSPPSHMVATALQGDHGAFHAGSKGSDSEACALTSVGVLTRLKVDHLVLSLRVLSLWS